ncbi:glycosyltransferase family 2 protein, partial [Nostoc sp. NIES-2111]
MQEFERNESPPAASVIIVNFNRVNLLAECLGSLARQSFQDFELIVVDNGSRDGSREWVAEHFPQAKVIANESNRGFCEANNQGFAAARGKYFVLLNNDAVADREWLGELVRRGEADPRCGMVASKVYGAGTERVIDKVGHLIYLDGQ